MTTAKKTPAKSPPISTGRGTILLDRFWPCVANGALHQQPVALQINKGPRAFFMRCPVCCSRTYFAGTTWRDDFGMTLEQARAARYQVFGLGVI